MLHKEILTPEQIKLLPLIKDFSKNFGLVGGTAIALHIGHRRSKELFKQEYNEKLFRSQLSFFDDINYDEEIEFLPGFKVSDNIIKRELVKLSLS